MARELSEKFKANLNVTSSCNPDIELIEITHPDLASVVRLSNFHEDVISNGEVYLATRFDVEWPSDKSGGEDPRAKIKFDNIGRSITQWVEQSQGGRCGEIVLKIINKECPDEIGLELCMDITSICMDCEKILITIGYGDLNKPAVPILFDECHAPGLF